MKIFLLQIDKLRLLCNLRGMLICYFDNLSLYCSYNNFTAIFMAHSSCNANTRRVNIAPAKNRPLAQKGTLWLTCEVTNSSVFWFRRCLRLYRTSDGLKVTKRQMFYRVFACEYKFNGCLEKWEYSKYYIHQLN